MALATRREVNVVSGEGVIRGVLMKAETDVLSDGGREVRYWSVRLEHAGMPVKVPATEAVFKQIQGAEGNEVEFDVQVSAAIDRNAREGKGANALRLDYLITSARVLAGDMPNPGLDLTPTSKKKSGVF